LLVPIKFIAKLVRVAETLSTAIRGRGPWDSSVDIVTRLRNGR